MCTSWAPIGGSHRIWSWNWCRATACRRSSRAAPLPIADALAIGRQIVDAIEFAHDAGIIHRDLKPANVEVEEPDGTVKVLDFGLAKAVEEPKANAEPHGLADSPTFTASAHTMPGVIVGTAAYMSPEQARGARPLNRRSDIWAFGAVLYELLAGQATLPGDTVADVLSAVVSRDPICCRCLRTCRPPSANCRRVGVC